MKINRYWILITVNDKHFFAKGKTAKTTVFPGKNRNEMAKRFLSACFCYTVLDTVLYTC